MTKVLTKVTRQEFINAFRDDEILIESIKQLGNVVMAQKIETTEVTEEWIWFELP